MSNWCDCGNGKHTRYITRSTSRKNNHFNKPMVKYVRKILLDMPKSAKYWVMDASTLGSSHALADAGVPPGRITAFSHCRYDYLDMLGDPLVVKKACREAESVYKSISGGYHVVIDDGMQLAINTMPRLKELFARRPKYLALMCNLSRRNKYPYQLRFHRDFAKHVRAEAKNCNMEVVKLVKLNTYRQGSGSGMQPYWMVLRAKDVEDDKKYIIID